MGYIGLIIYIIVALVFIVFLFVLLFDRKEYIGSPIETKEDLYFYNEISDRELQKILYSLKPYQKPLFLDLYNYLKSFGDLSFVENGKQINIYSKEVILFSLKFNDKAIIFETTFKGIVYPNSFVVRGKKIQSHIYTEANLFEVKTVINQLVNAILYYDFSRNLNDKNPRKKARQG